MFLPECLAATCSTVAHRHAVVTAATHILELLMCGRAPWQAEACNSGEKVLGLSFITSACPSRGAGKNNMPRLYSAAHCLTAQTRFTHGSCDGPQGAPYVDRLKYAEQGKEKPGRGFNTSDYMRTDEFTMTFRTEQYRTLLKVWPSLAVLCCTAVAHFFRQLSSKLLH